MNLLHSLGTKSLATGIAIAIFSFSPVFAGHGGGHYGGGHYGGGHYGGGYYGGGYGGIGYWPYYGGYYNSGYGYGYGSTYPGYTYSSGYASPPVNYTSPGASQPYLTNQTYEPGDGYRYPLYYDPATGTYFYYPVAR